MIRKVNPEVFSLSFLRWQLFCTFSLKNERCTESLPVRMYFAWLRKLADNLKVHFKSVLWCLRLEFGEKTGRRHYHALIGGLPEYRIDRLTIFASKNLWEHVGGGMARVYQFNPSLEGVDYVLGGVEEMKHQHSLGASLYEFSKFSGATKVMLSESVILAIQGRRGHYGAERLLPATVQRPVSNPLKEGQPRTDTHDPA